MPVRLLLDEHLRGGLVQAVAQHNRGGGLPLDVAAVGDPPDPPLGTPDPDILAWAEREGRVLVTRDRRTMPRHLAAHLAAGRRSPGVAVLRRGLTLAQIVACLELIAHAGDPADFADRVTFVP